MKYNVVNGVLDGTVEEMIQFFSKTNQQVNVHFKAASASADVPVKRGPGRPRKNPEVQSVQVNKNPIEWLKTTKDVLHTNVKKRSGWKHLSPNKSRKENTYTFYVSQEAAEKAAQSAGINKKHIFVIRPTAAAKDYEKYPKFYFIEENRTAETALNARGQYTQLWNRNHNDCLPQDISIHLSTKRVYKVSRKTKKA